MLHNLVKISEILYLSVCQIPIPIRSFLRILGDSLQSKNPSMQKVDLYRILNELVIDKWLSVSFAQPEFFGILPKPLNFTERHKNIFFLTAQKVLQHTFRMEPIDRLGQFDEFFDLERINDYIKH
jgi:GTPase-activator protein for Ras-like GTPase